MAGDKGIDESSGAVSEPPGASAAAGSRTVFLSYASPDAAVANQVCEYLESHGVACWMAPRDVKPGAAYADAIVRAINEASALVLVLSASAMASEHVSREVERAASKHKPVVAFRVDGANLSAELEYFLSRSQWIDVPVLGMPGALVTLAEAVGRGSAVSSQADPGLGSGGAGGRASINQAVGTASVASRVIVAAAVVIALSLGGVLAVRFWQSKHRESPAPAVAAISDKSIAVLPFADMSEKKDQEYFADGLADEVLSLLATLPDLNVISRTSSFQFKGKNVDLRTLGAQLGAAYVVEGSVRKSGDRVRVTAQLISTQDGAHRWSDTYERNFGDVLRLQQELATSLGRALEVEVGGLAEHGAAPLTHPDAYTAFLHGLHSLDRYDETGLDEAIGYFEQALAVDPDLLRARENLARARYYQYILGLVTPPIAAERLRRAVDDVFRVNPRSAMGHALRAEVLITYDWDWAAAQQEANLAVALARNSAFALYAAADIASVFERWDEAEGLLRQALAVDPLDPDIRNLLSWTLYRQGHFKAAELEGRRVVQVRPSYFTGHLDLGLYLLAEGESQLALGEMQQELSDTARPVGVAIALSALGRNAEADAALRLAERESAHEFAYFIAGAHASRGKTDAAFQWLDRAYVQKDFLLEYIKGEPLLKSLVADPRYKALLKKMNLPE